jgi:hypothetical protein
VQRGAIAFRVDGNRRHAQLTTRADDAHGDLAAIGYQYLLQEQRLL